ncbi:amidohydrolase family protein [Blastococcus sp. SYSU D00820]
MRTLLRGAHVVTMDPDVGDLVGDVLLDGDRIVQVGPTIADGYDEVVDLRGSVLVPGFVDTHIHLWQSALRGLASSCWGREYFGLVHPLSGRLRPDDMFEATRGGALELLSHGVTTTLDFCHATNSAAHADASIAGLTDAGIRALFAFSFRPRPEAGSDELPTFGSRVEELQRLAAAHDGPVRMAVSLNNIEHVSPDAHAAEVQAARELGLKATVHANLPGQVAQSAGQGLLGDDLLWVHCGPITDAELDLLAEARSPLLITPEVEAGQMGITPNLGRALRRGVPVGIGTDSPTAVNGDPFVQMRIALALDRHSDSTVDRLAGRPPARRAGSPALDPRRVLELATIGGARALGMDAEIGSITPGKCADLVVVDTEPFGLGGAEAAEHVVLQAGSGAVGRVYVGGRLVVADRRLHRPDLPEIRERLAASRDFLLGRTPDTQWPEMTAELRARYEAGQGRAF